jgi:hypothetical protein
MNNSNIAARSSFLIASLFVGTLLIVSVAAVVVGTDVDPIVDGVP